MTESFEPSQYPDSLLQAIRPSFKRSESPKPIITESHTSSDEEEGEGSDVRGRGRRVRPSQGDRVLINHLEPNRPDIAQLFSERALDPASPTPETEPATEPTTEDMGEVVGPQDPAYNPIDVAYKALRVAGVGSDQQSTAAQLSHEPINTLAPLTNLTMQQPDLSMSKPPRILPRPIRTEPPVGEMQDEDTIATSPNLAQYTIKPSEPIASTLPALQNSPSKANSMQSPANTQSLPSLKTALGDSLPDTSMTSAIGSALPPISATSPSLPRSTTTYLPPVSGPSPNTFHPSPASSKDMSVISPPSGHPSHPSYWRNGPKSETSMGSTFSDSTTPSTSTVSHSSPGSAYPTPSQSQDTRTGLEGDQSHLINGPLQPNGPFTSSAFKCTYPGCTAQPFQTQYLLNSHTNVHSSNRPHYCPVEGCPRGLGGKGFKRKNEMIRHGLVHDSPGYVCPFCPDQQHRYPRPDNLQRHVRVHHVDKDKDDPQLREVLAQRPEGPNRGRRRRLGS